MFKKLKGKLKHDEHATASSGLSNPPPTLPQAQQHSTSATLESHQTDPPPGHGTNDAPPFKPLTGQSSELSSPAGGSSAYPSQPPPSWDPPPYHDWTVIPDTALLPPPPSMGYDTSPTANASAQESDRALAWTHAHPLWPPQNNLPPSLHAAIQNAQLALLKPPSYLGDLLPQPQAGHWRCRSQANCRDASLLTNLPMYAALWDSPLVTQRPKTIYFELKILAMGHRAEESDAGIAIGFAAPPYPTFRLPGWERASLGVHGDDGRKYVNDRWGGVDFTTAFQPGETVGIGMTFAVPRDPPSYVQTPGPQRRLLDIDVFFTRNGERQGGWDGNEELDVRSEGGSVGLRGDLDLFPAIGVFGGVDLHVLFHPCQWMYTPY